MLAALTVVAEIIGFIVLGAIGLMLLAMAGAYVNDLIRTRNLRYDLYQYDDVARWNSRQRKLAARQKADHDDVSKAKRQWRSKSPGTARLN
jgi:hypothetical protein